jgi:4-amino-4-deoxy-L-arabinose transferase-like glycosyltransferase
VANFLTTREPGSETPAAPSEPPGTSGRQRIPRRAFIAAAIVASLAVVLAGGAVALKRLGQEQPRLSGTNAIVASEKVATLTAGEKVCQDAAIPDETRAIELRTGSSPAGHKLSLTARLAGSGRVLVAKPNPVQFASSVRFSLPEVVAHETSARLCIHSKSGPPLDMIGAMGRQSAPDIQIGLTQNGALQPKGGISTNYYRDGKESLLALAPTIAERIGRVRGATGGPWRGVAILILTLAGIGLAAWVVVAGIRGRVSSLRRAALLVASVAVLNALAWSLLTPVFQIPDEPPHLSYIQDLAEKGTVPKAGNPSVSDELTQVITASGIGQVNFNPAGRTPWSAGSDKALADALAQKPSRVNKGSQDVVRDYPPAYYLAGVPAYALTTAIGGSSDDALSLIRALSALLAGVTVLALIAMLLEIFPRRPVLAVGAGLVCAYQPVLTWISGGVNPDSLFIAEAAVLFWLFARAFRRGLSVRLAAGIGAVTAALALTKLTGLAFAPASALALALAVWKALPRDGTSRIRAAIASAGSFAVPMAVYAVLNTAVWGRTLIPGAVGDAAASAGGPAAPGPGTAEKSHSFITYMWEYFLPPLHSMLNIFQSPYSPITIEWAPRDLWVPMWLGRFGWYDYQFPDRVNHDALWLFGLILVAALVTGVRLLLRERVLRWQLIALGLLSGALVLAVARTGYNLRIQGNWIFEQARYFLPLIGLFALALALAAGAVPRRLRWPAGIFVLLLAIANLLGAFAITVSRYYI